MPYSKAIFNSTFLCVFFCWLFIAVHLFMLRILLVFWISNTYKNNFFTNPNQEKWLKESCITLINDPTNILQKMLLPDVYHWICPVTFGMQEAWTFYLIHAFNVRKCPAYFYTTCIFLTRAFFRIYMKEKRKSEPNLQLSFDSFSFRLHIWSEFF